MKYRNLLYYATGGWLGIIVLTGLYFLSRSTTPSADVTYTPGPEFYNFDVSGIEPGQFVTYRTDNVPVVLWRRNFEQKVQSLELIGFDVTGDAKLLEQVRMNAGIETEPDRVLRFEWFVVSSINKGGYGCIVLPNAGNLGGFYDPCQGVHFDLWGRVANGPTEKNLQLLPWRMSDNGKEFTVDVRNAPRLE